MGFANYEYHNYCGASRWWIHPSSGTIHGAVFKQCSKQSEAATLLEGLSWTHALLNQFPDQNSNAGPTLKLPIPVVSDSIVGETHGRGPYVYW
jgi:hypothetical protein